ncbi:MAG: hypothetical protein EA422_02470 [Gemmatimonadales bacterium]|nr:MAG: hypothetical protein EA422_02470 [Gemmatimonadales bacterium]
MIRSTTSRHIAPALAVLATLFAVLLAAPSELEAQEKNVVVHIGSYNEDVQSALMGLNLASRLQDAGATVTVYLDRNAVRMAETRQPLFQYADSDLEAIVRDFVAGGGRFLVCGHCAGLAGLDEAGFREGFVLTGPEQTVPMFMEADIVISF